MISAANDKSTNVRLSKLLIAASASVLAGCARPPLAARRDEHDAGAREPID
jgi:hypothetical protein